MTKLKQAARQALEALESKLGETHPFAYDLEKAAAIRTLREALAEQAEQGPVLYPVRRGSRITCIESGEKCIVWATSHTDCWVQFPDGHAGQYTYEQIGKYFSIEENQAADEAYERGSKEGIEAGKKIAEQAEQEPVAYLCPSFVDNFATGRYETCERTDYGAFPTYAAPVRTKDLTDDEIEKAFWGNGDTEIEGCRAVIAADREKNK